MKKLTTLFLAFIFVFGVASITWAQMPAPYSPPQADRSGMRGVTIADDHTAREEAAGKAIWEKFQAKEITCDKLTNDDFDALGEYFMGQMMGSSHVAVNAMMTQMLGEDGETQMHIVMGKRLSSCNTSAAFPAGGTGFMPMMQMMWGGWSSPFGFNSTNNMMNFGYGLGFFGWVLMILWWALIIAVLAAVVKWLANQFRGGSSGKSALDILKERYAKGEIDKREFEEKKKELEA